jgi:hypothetical protein
MLLRVPSSSMLVSRRSARHSLQQPATRRPPLVTARRCSLLLVPVLVGVLVHSALPSRASSRTGAAAAEGHRSDSYRVRSELFPAFSGAVPVLLYHRLSAGNDPYTVAPATFDDEMQRLHDLGFEAITLDQYVGFMRGENEQLPPRPILITFDDAVASSWEHADPVLARYGWSAAMYVPTGFIGRAGYLTWDQLRQMQASGRWQIDEHAGDGHVSVIVNAAGGRGPFYANELWLDGRQESFDEYKLRVSRDIRLGAETLSRLLPGWSSHGTFAVPFNNYGQHGSNDPQIALWLGDYLKSRFAVVFLQSSDDRFATPNPGFSDRIFVPSSWDGNTLERRLVDGLAATPGLPPAAGSPAQAATKKT